MKYTVLIYETEADFSARAESQIVCPRSNDVRPGPRSTSRRGRDLCAPSPRLFEPGERRQDREASGMLVGQQGSWNRQALDGYNVVFVPIWRVTRTR